MVRMSPSSLPSEHGWEAKTFGHLLFRNLFVATFCLTDHELADLQEINHR